MRKALMLCSVLLLCATAAMAMPSKESIDSASRWLLTMAANIIWLLLAAFLIPATRSFSSGTAVTLELMFGLVSLGLGGYLFIQMLNPELAHGFGAPLMWVSISIGLSLVQLWIGYKAVRHSRERTLHEDD